MRKRRAVAAGIAGLAGLTGVAAGPAMADSSAPSPTPAAVSIPAASAANGYRFLDQMMDKYATGPTPRLIQSFVPDAAMGDFTASVTYDDALVVDALLARGTADDVARAEVIGNALLYVQTHDASQDGRIRAGYAPTPLTSPSQITATNPASDVGNMAWVGQALVQLAARTGNTDYLTGAAKLAAWIQANTYDTRGVGGYTGGFTGSTKILWKSTEHNVDVYSLFSLIATATGDASWSADAAHAQAFVAAMWDPAGRKYWVGTDETGVALNTGFQPEDVNTWTYLAFKDPARATSIDWNAANLAAVDGAFTGVGFAACDRTKVWFEGTAHMAAALAVRNGPGDAAKAQAYLDSIQLAQTTAPNADGLGIVAASHDKLSGCDAGDYFAAPHIGATAWYLMAGAAVNPFFLLPASGPAAPGPAAPGSHG